MLHTGAKSSRMMDELAENMRNATPERRRAASMSIPARKDRTGLTHEQVREIVANPMQEI
jgi:hypothetical protein